MAIMLLPQTDSQADRQKERQLNRVANAVEQHHGELIWEANFALHLCESMNSTPYNLRLDIFARKFLFQVRDVRRRRRRRHLNTYRLFGG